MIMKILKYKKLKKINKFKIINLKIMILKKNYNYF